MNVSDKKVGYLLFEQFHGKENIGSSRIRGHFHIKNWPGSEMFMLGRKYDIVVYQKVYWFQHAEQFGGLKILDVCDPDFLHYGYPVKRMLEACDGLTTSTVALAEAMSAFTDKPVAHIADRFDFEHLPTEFKKHREGPSKIAAWYGYSQNYPLLNAAVTALVRHGFEKLIVVSDRKNPYVLPAGMNGKIELVNYPFSAATYLKDLMEADVVINPRSTSAHWRFKSENKTALAWLIGMPVAHDEAELKKLLTFEDRVRESNARREFARKNYNVVDSVKEMQEFCAMLWEKKFGNVPVQGVV